MWKLIKLEWKKNKVGKYVRNALILAAALSLFLFAFTYLGIANDPDTGKPDAVQEEHTLSSTVEMFTSISFLVFTGVMLASFLVAAYQNKTMALMFLYPIKRQKILLSQMLAVWLFNLAALFTTKLLLYGVLLVGAQFLEPAFPLDFDMADIGFYLQAAIKAAVTVSMGFIALYVGLAMQSAKATIIASFLLIFLTQANIGDFSMAGNMVMPLLLATVSLVCAVLSICGVERRDLK